MNYYSLSLSLSLSLSPSPPLACIASQGARVYALCAARRRARSTLARQGESRQCIDDDSDDSDDDDDDDDDSGDECDSGDVDDDDRERNARRYTGAVR